MNNVIEVLRERGLLDNFTSKDIYKVIESPITVYAGFDPTSDSLQVGNLAAIMALAHFQRCGHRVIAVVGGATGMIGDPSGKNSERVLLSIEEVEKNIEGIKENLSGFLDFEHPTAPAVILNNNVWFENFTFISFLRDVGKHFRMGAMLGKDSVRTRLNSESGMSFAEFSYQLLQAYDFFMLYDTKECILQIGGSDQWGNITAGIDLIHKLRGNEAYGLTFPLICDSVGQKFGKSEGNSIYLSHDKTSYYDFYQFFVRTMDADVIRFLKIFTFLDIDEIIELERQVEKSPEDRVAQKRLAEEVTRIVHGNSGLNTALSASSVLFGKSMAGLKADDLLNIFADVPSIEIHRNDLVGALLVDVVVLSGLCKSRSDARRLIENGGLYLNNKRVEDIKSQVNLLDIIDNRLIVLRSGKKTFYLVKAI